MAICTVTGTICKADESPMPNQLVKATIKSTQQDQGGQVAGFKGVVSDPIEAFSGDDGTFGIDLVQGATVVFEIPTINLRKEIVIPALVSVDFTTLI